jgi:hypothetical protein
LRLLALAATRAREREVFAAAHGFAANLLTCRLLHLAPGSSLPATCCLLPAVVYAAARCPLVAACCVPPLAACRVLLQNDLAKIQVEMQLKTLSVWKKKTAGMRGAKERNASHFAPFGVLLK